MARAKEATEVVFGKVTDKNVEQLQRLNTALFPVRYNEKFYRDAIVAPEGFVHLAYYQGVLVGAVLVRKETRAEGGDKLYIMTLGVLAPYRERGIGNQLLNHVFELCRTNKLCQNVKEIYLHVHTANEEAIQFYKKRGFQVVETIEHYYKRGVEPPDCYLLSKKLEDVSQSDKS
mmetsp:Transcript_3365/g.10243  ORF Transcript_3365/g.10243 Transcript_3365/m.10243 type:complete len:174 (-) Transcript_3365:132-653(-)